MASGRKIFFGIKLVNSMHERFIRTRYKMTPCGVFIFQAKIYVPEMIQGRYYEKRERKKSGD